MAKLTRRLDKLSEVCKLQLRQLDMRQVQPMRMALGIRVEAQFLISIAGEHRCKCHR